MGRFAGRNRAWGSYVDAKADIATVLARQVHRRRGKVLLGSVTDGYQPVEEGLRLSRACLEVLCDSALAVSILTKSPLVVRDLDILARFGGLLREERVEVGFTITTPSDELSCCIEPGAPPTSDRLRAIRTCADAGIRVWVFLAPVIPGISDTEERLEAMADLVRSHGASSVAFDPLNFYPASVRGLRSALERTYPDVLTALDRVASHPDPWRAEVRRIADRVARKHPRKTQG